MQLIKVILIVFFININFCLARESVAVNINSVRIWPSPDSIRIVFDLSKPVDYKIYDLIDPTRLVIDFSNAILNKKLIEDLHKAPKLAMIKKIRSRMFEKQSRVVFELDKKLVFNSFTLKPNERYGHRLIIDLEYNEKQAILALFDLKNNSDKIKKNQNQNQNHNFNVIVNKKIIAIDAGHGGEDPGAVGRYGTEEKNVVLDIAKKLQEYINKQPDKLGLLIRKGDYYVSLRDRMLVARKYKADLFISIHADAFSDPKSDGGSVFVLSEKGASSAAARWLATSENRADTLGGVKINHKIDGLASVLLDLSQTANYNSSFRAAKSILYSMKNTMSLHKNEVERANFAVLKAPDVPSVLIEAGFISNPRTELKLRSSQYQHQVAKSILQGIDQYFLAKSKKL